MDDAPCHFLLFLAKKYNGSRGFDTAAWEKRGSTTTYMCDLQLEPFSSLVWNTILFWQAFNCQKVFMHTEIFLNVIQKLSIAKHLSLFYSYQISLEQKLQWSMDHCFCFGLFMVIHYDRCLLAEIRVYAGITTSIISFNVNNTYWNDGWVTFYEIST